MVRRRRQPNAELLWQIWEACLLLFWPLLLSFKVEFIVIPSILYSQGQYCTNDNGDDDGCMFWFDSGNGEKPRGNHGDR